MGMIGHAINRDQFLPTLRHDSGDIFLQFLFVIGPNNAGTPRYRKTYMPLTTTRIASYNWITVNMTRLRRLPQIDVQIRNPARNELIKCRRYFGNGKGSSDVFFD